MSNKKKTFISITISIFPYSDITKFESTRNIKKLCKKKKNHMKNKPVLVSYTYYQVFVTVFTGTVFHPVSPPPFPCVFACGLGGTAAAVTHLCHYHKLWSSPPFSQIVPSSIVSCAFCFFCGYCLTRVQISTISLLNNHLKCLHLFTCDTCLVWKPSENTPWLNPFTCLPFYSTTTLRVSAPGFASIPNTTVLAVISACLQSRDPDDAGKSDGGRKLRMAVGNHWEWRKVYMLKA